MTDVSLALVLSAFQNQDTLNKRLTPEWASQDWPYYRAIYREAVEVFDHLNWEWWKKGSLGKPVSERQKRDICIELADILHFGLSLDIIKCVQCHRDLAHRAQDYVLDFADATSSTEPLDVAMENLIVDAILIREFNTKKFARACNAVGLSLQHIMAYYFGKTVLNEFRWSNGYNLPDGNPEKYQKTWRIPEYPEGVEDNVPLAMAIDRVIGGKRMSSLAHGILDGAYSLAVSQELSDIYATRS